LTFLRLCGHAFAFFRSFEEALDPGTHTVSPKASNPFTISPTSQRREETAAVIYCHLAARDLNRGYGITSDGGWSPSLSGRNIHKMTIADTHWPRHDCVMGSDPAEPVIPGLLSTDGVRAAVPSSPTVNATKEATEAVPQRHILPKNLRHAISQLSDGDWTSFLRRLSMRQSVEAGYRKSVGTDVAPSALRPSEMTTKRSPPTNKQRKVDIAEVPLTRGLVNAIRAAFKAGATPSRIARQFGVSQSNIRKALATEPSK
jgi:hypothetical protein